MDHSTLPKEICTLNCGVLHALMEKSEKTWKTMTTIRIGSKRKEMTLTWNGKRREMKGEGIDMIVMEDETVTGRGTGTGTGTGTEKEKEAEIAVIETLLDHREEMTPHIKTEGGAHPLHIRTGDVDHHLKIEEDLTRDTVTVIEITIGTIEKTEEAEREVLVTVMALEK